MGRYLTGSGGNAGAGTVPSGVTDILHGGTGATSASGALANLGGIPLTLIGALNGVAGLDGTGHLPSSVVPSSSSGSVTIDGPTTVGTGSTNSFFITNYDDFTTYTVSATSGTVTRNVDYISYTAPNLVGTYGFTVNGKTVQVIVNNNYINEPTITSPTTGAVNIGSSYTLTSSAFGTTGVTTHESSTWQIATDVNFTNIIAQTTDNTSAKVSWTASGFAESITYYARVRYKGVLYGYSAWSNTISFTTKAAFIPTNVSSILSGFGQYYGIQTPMSMTDDGLRMTHNDTSGNVNVYVRAGLNDSWTIEQYISGPITGHGLLLVDSNTILVSTTIVNTNDGQVRTYKRVGSVWSLTSTYTPPAVCVWLCGYRMCMSKDKSTVVSMVKNGPAAGPIKLNYFTLSNGSLIYVSSLTTDINYSSTMYGICSSLNDDGTLLVGMDGTGIRTYTRTGTVWSLVDFATPSQLPIPLNNAMAQTQIRLINNGESMLIGINIGTGGYSSGVIRKYNRAGLSWDYSGENDIYPNDASLSTVILFGSNFACPSDGSMVVSYGEDTTTPLDKIRLITIE
jgi:hypothetical protein